MRVPLLLLTLWGLASAETVPKVISVCEVLANPAAFHAKRVAVVGAYVVGFEASSLFGRCAGEDPWLKGLWVDVAPPASVRLPPEQLSRKVIVEKLRVVAKTTSLHQWDEHDLELPEPLRRPEDHWAVILGRVDVGSGFGHLGAFHLRILQSEVIRRSCS